MIRFLFLVFVIDNIAGKSCPTSYLPIDAEDMCVHLSSRTLNLDQLPTYCMNEASGGVPMTKRFSDKGIKELARKIKRSVENLFPTEVYIGMQREKDSMNRDTDTFKFSNDEGTIKDKEYKLWDSDPTYFDCGVVSYNKSFKVVPFPCSNSAVFLCEKNEGTCESKSFRYVAYHERCLGVYAQKDTFVRATYICSQFEGHLATYKTKEESSPIGEAIFNSLTIEGGIYAGLRRNGSGEWSYEGGGKETSRWDPEDDRPMDCGVHRFLKDLTLALYTMSCSEPLRGLCEYIDENFIRLIPQN